LRFTKRSLVVTGFSVVAAAAAIWWLAQTSTRDTEDTLYPTPAARTAFRLRQLQVKIQRYEERQQRPPDSLSEIVTSEGARLLHDAWGAAIIYNRSGSTYELRSPGADGRPHTVDDIVLDSSMRDVHP